MGYASAPAGYANTNIGDLPYTENGNLAEYNGQIMQAQQAQEQYQKDVQAKGAKSLTTGLANGGNSPAISATTPPANPTITDIVNNQFATMNQSQLLNLQRRLQAAGYLSAGKYQAGTPDPGTVAAFASLLKDTNDSQTMDPSATWTSVLQGAINNSGWTVLPNGDFQRTISKTPSINPTAAQAALNAQLGRNASPGEIKSFMDTYNQIMASSPLDTTETLNKAGMDQTNAPAYATQSQTIQQAELQAAQANPDYATYQAATTYWNAMQQALGATGQVENNLK
jgi:hypothetical protein